MIYTLDTLKLAFINDGRGYALRTWNSYTKVRDKHQLVCPKHPNNDWLASIHPILSKRKLGCPLCKFERASINLRGDMKDVSLRLLKHGFKLVGEYKNMQIQTQVECLTCNTVSSMKITNILHGKQGCFECSGKKKFTHESAQKRLSSFSLSLVGEYNGDIQQRQDVICLKCGHIRNTQLIGPLSKGGCPSCSVYGFSKLKHAVLYYVYGKNENGEYYKIGITNRTTSSRNKQTFNSHKVLFEYQGNGLDCYNIEQQLLEKFKHLIQTEHKFSGSTECFTVDIREYINLSDFISNTKTVT